MNARCSGLLAILLLVALGAFAQSSTTSPLSGTIQDPTGAIVPGAEITVRNADTGATFKTTTGANGTFLVPALPTGTYSVMVSAAGFKQAQVNDVKLDVGVPANVKVSLEVGSAAESVTVEGVGAVLQTQSATVSTTLTGRQIVDLPLVSRDSLDLVLFLPGVNTPGRPRSSNIDGLPDAALNITIDGINVQDNGSKGSDGYFTYIRPRLDAIQEVTVSTAGGTADSSGEGAAQIKFVTRSGTNDYRGSLYYYHRNTALNANYWFSNRDSAPDPATGKAPRTPANLHQFGFRVGGPISVPGLFSGSNRAFFFMNYEEFRLPEAIFRQRTILSPEAQAGIFLYDVTSGGVTTTRRVDLMQLAAANGQTATFDPTVANLLRDIRASTEGIGITALTDPNLQRFSYNAKGGQWRKFPTVRLDFNLTSKHQLETSFNYQDFAGKADFLNSTDPTFPNFPVQGSQGSNRKSGVVALRSTLTPRMVNEARFGMMGGTTLFRPELSAAQFSGPLANQGGFNLGIGAAAADITSATSSSTVSRDQNPVTQFQDNLTVSKGSHNFTMGASYTQVRIWAESQTVVPGITFSVDQSNDPARTMFTTGNFQGASNTNLNHARDLYAVLTGRVTAITGTAPINEDTGKYSYLGKSVNRSRQRQFGLFMQDNWRMRPHFTLNYGVRWEVQFPHVALNNRYARTTYEGLFGVSGPGNLFKPGTLQGAETEFVAVVPGEHLYLTQWGNFAPNAGFAWTPQNAWGPLKTILGGGKGVLRAGYSLAFLRDSADNGTALSGNPGGSITVNRNNTLGNLIRTGEAWPLLFRESGRLGAPAFNDTPVYPFKGEITNTASAWDPNVKLPYVHSWNVALQRELGKEMAVEFRYVGNYFGNPIVTRNLNELNIVENGVLNEFRLAQANLRANIAAGRGTTFRYFGEGTGTSPLPIALAYFSGIAAARAGDASLYTSTNFSSSTFVDPLRFQNPAPGTFAGALDDDAQRRTNAINAGLAANFLLVNPGKLGGANLFTNYGFSNYNAGSVELRRRFSKGLLVNANYTFGKGFESVGRGWRADPERAVSGLSIIHVFKVNWLYELPVGKGRQFLGSANRWVDGLLGGWGIYGGGRVQSGQPLGLGDVRLVGMTRNELQDEIQIRKGGSVVYYLPDDLILNTRRANNFSNTSASGYGDLGAPEGRYIAPGNNSGCIAIFTGQCGGTDHIVWGPRFVRFDISAVKKVNITERVNVELRGEFLNAFNNTNFVIGSVNNSESNIGGLGNTGFGQLTAAYRDNSTTNDPGGRLVQLVLRVNF